MISNTNRPVYPVESAAFRWLMRSPLVDPVEVVAARAAIAATLRLLRYKHGRYVAKCFRAEVGRMGQPIPLERCTREASLNKNAAFMRRFNRQYPPLA